MFCGERSRQRVALNHRLDGREVVEEPQSLSFTLASLGLLEQGGTLETYEQYSAEEHKA